MESLRFLWEKELWRQCLNILIKGKLQIVAYKSLSVPCICPAIGKCQDMRVLISFLHINRKPVIFSHQLQISAYRLTTIETVVVLSRQRIDSHHISVDLEAKKRVIRERKNYNVGSGKRPMPLCPPEKEEAIKDALRHFGLI